MPGLRRKVTKAMRKRIKKTSARVAMVKKTVKPDGSVSVFFATIGVIFDFKVHDFKN